MLQHPSSIMGPLFLWLMWTATHLHKVWVSSRVHLDKKIFILTFHFFFIYFFQGYFNSLTSHHFGTTDHAIWGPDLRSEMQGTIFVLEWLLTPGGWFGDHLSARQKKGNLTPVPSSLALSYMDRSLSPLDLSVGFLTRWVRSASRDSLWAASCSRIFSSNDISSSCSKGNDMIQYMSTLDLFVGFLTWWVFSLKGFSVSILVHQDVFLKCLSSCNKYKWYDTMMFMSLLAESVGFLTRWVRPASRDLHSPGFFP